MKRKHTKTGNCSHKSVLWRNGELQDACPDHDEPRGECSVCPPCPACETIAANEAARTLPAKGAR